MKEISIEYAHIYTNQRIDDEHKKSIEILDALKAELSNKTSSLVVMVDDYSFPDPTFDYKQFGSWLSNHSHGPNVLIRESQLMSLCDQVIQLIQDSELRAEITDYIKAKKYPCSLFIATWYLLRLGYLESDIFPGEEVAQSLINILPESFKPFEEKGLDIIRSTQFATAADKIEYRFFKGRLIA